MKRIFSAIVVASMILGISAFAADSSISITEKKIENGLVSVSVKNSAEIDTELAMTVVKDDDSADLNKKIYAVYQQAAKAGETVVFNFFIPEDKDGLSGAGTYIIKVEDSYNELIEDSVRYVGEMAVADFVDALADEAEKVNPEEPEKAYELLGVIFFDDDNKNTIESLGVDYEELSSAALSVKNDTMNILYAMGIDKLNADNAGEAINSAYATAVFNSGDKVDGLNKLTLTYNEKSADSKLYSDAIEAMKSSYSTPDTLKEDFEVAYGFATINNAKVDTLCSILDIFADVTGLCKADIEKVNNLSPTKRYVAYEYIIEYTDNNNITSETELKTVLEQAYSAATKNTMTGLGGGGGGGGASGSSANKVTSGSGSINVTQGSGGTDKKAEATVIFSDLPIDHWAAESVEYLKKLGVVNGNENGEFEPDRAVTREEFTKMLVVACGIEIDGKDTTFADAKVGEWYRPYIAAATENGIVNGMGDNLFGIGATITRQDMAVMVARAMKTKGMEISKVKEYVLFADADKIADYAANEITMLYEAGIINGKGAGFDPVGNASRAEAAKIIYEAFKGGN